MFTNKYFLFKNWMQINIINLWNEKYPTTVGYHTENVFVILQLTITVAVTFHFCSKDVTALHWHIAAHAQYNHTLPLSPKHWSKWSWLNLGKFSYLTQAPGKRYVNTTYNSTLHPQQLF